MRDIKEILNNFYKINYKLCSIGLFFLILGILFSPSFIANHFFPDGILKESTLILIKKFRFAMIASGVLITIIGILFEKWKIIISKVRNSSENTFFNYRTLKFGVFFFAIIMVSNLIVSLINIIFINCDCALYFPISVFLHRIPNSENLFAAIAISIFFFFAIKYISISNCKIQHIIIIGIILVLGTNLIQGYEHGFIDPITGGVDANKGGGNNVLEYYHDAIKINETSYFLYNFEKMQPDLLVHSKVHPPGAVLIIYFLLKISKNPALISILIAIISISLSTFFLYKILLTEFKEDISKYITFLFILIPSIQIYYLASIDALISSFLLGFLYFYIKSRDFINIIGSIIFLFLTSFLTFTFIFILPIIIGYEILIKRKISQSSYILLSLGFIYIIINIIFNFNYINSLIIASALENPTGFRLFSDPVSYIVTRIENIFEIILFFGPFLTLLSISGFHNMKRTKSNLLTLSWLAILTLLIIFATGAYRSGETARNTLFIYPYLLFPIALYLQDFWISEKDRKKLVYLVFAQTILMQLFGYYIW